MAEIAKNLGKTRNNGSETLVELNDAKRTKVWRPTASVPSSGNSTAQPATSIAGQMEALANKPSDFVQHTDNFVKAMQMATKEGAMQRQAASIGLGLGAVAGPGGQLAPGSAAGIVDMIRGSVGVDAATVFGGATRTLGKMIDAEAAEKDFQMRMLQFKQEVQTSNFTMLSTLASSGALINTPNDALTGIAEQAGLDSNIVLAWKARLTEVDKMDNEIRSLEIEKIKAEIERTKALTRNTGNGGEESGTETGDVGSYSFLDSGIEQLLDEGQNRNNIISQAIAAADSIGLSVKDPKVRAAVEQRVDQVMSARAGGGNGGGGDTSNQANASAPSSLPGMALKIGGSILMSTATAPIREVQENLKQKAINLGVHGVLSGIGNFFGE